MSALRKTIVATGCTSGLGFEAIKKLLSESQPYHFILGARNPKTAEDAFSAVSYNKSTHALSVLPLQLADLKSVKTFAQSVQEKLGQDKLDYLMLNAAVQKGNTEPGPNGSKWSEAAIVNHFSQHYLIHLLREKLVESQARIVVVSSGGITRVKDTAVLEHGNKGSTDVDWMGSYCNSKFIQLLNAHWWRRQLKDQCVVIATLPGLIAGTNLGRHTGFVVDVNTMTDAKPVEQGGANIVNAMFRDDFPENPDQIFLTSWGEWWGTDVIQLSLDKELQDWWSPSLEEIENNTGIMAQ